MSFGREQYVAHSERPVESGSSRNERLTAAMTWARLFLREAERSLSGKAHQLPRAAAQTVMAIEAIDGKPMDYDVCQCGHSHFWHHGEDGGMCLVQGCDCKVFAAVIK
jgi:hypothetical protein